MRMAYMHPYARRRFRRTLSEDIHLPVDVSVLEDTYIIRAYVPGVEAADLDLAVDGNTLTIDGEFALNEDENEQSRLRELPSGKFHRRLHFSAELDANQAEASVANGVLTLRVAKAESAKTKRIAVKAN